MLNLIKSDLFKIKKGKSFYVCSIIVIVLDVLSIIGGIAINANDNLLGLTYDVLYLYISSLASINMFVIETIFVSRFFGKEFDEGTIKILVSKGNSRASIYLSKLITSIGVSFFFEILNIIMCLGVGSIFFEFDKGTAFETSIEPVDLLLIIICRAVIIACMVSFTIMYASSIRKSGSTIAASLATLILGALPFAIVDALYAYFRYKSDSLPKPYFDINSLWLYNSVDTFLTVDITNKMWQLLLLQFAVYGVGLTVLGICRFNKKDIN
ncbi:MAG: ABC transporter permease [Lachnospiraceae bacterium]|nr:ABC transporter permease [Lachnospiraceae bacterium]